METMPADDPRSLGQLNEEYLRARIRSPDETRRFGGIEGLDLGSGARTYAGTKQADDIVRLSANALGRRRQVPEGRYFVDYKAGDEAFDIEQAVRYARALEDDPQLRGILYIFTGRNPRGVTDPAWAAREAARKGQDAADEAAAAVMQHPNMPPDRRHRFLFAYIDEDGALRWH